MSRQQTPASQPLPTPPSVQAPKLRQLLIRHFNDSELHTLCFDLGIDYEDLPGNIKADKARELVAYVQRHQQEAGLLAECRRLRPQVDWSVVMKPDDPKDAQTSQASEAESSPVPAPGTTPAPDSTSRTDTVRNLLPHPASNLLLGLTSIGFLVSAIWLIAQPGFEPFIGVIGFLTALIELLAERKRSVSIAIGGGLVALVLVGIGSMIWGRVGTTQTVNIVVRVTESAGNPISRAGITLLYDGDSTDNKLTDTLGLVRFSEIKASSGATLIVLAEGYQAHEEQVDISQDKTLPVILQRQDSNKRSVLIRVTEAARFSPVQNAEVTLVIGGEIYTDVTDKHGIAHFNLPFEAPTITADLSVSAEGRTTSTQVITLQPDALQDARLDPASQDLTITSP